MKSLTIGLCAGRHNIPAVGGKYIFNDIVDPLETERLMETAANAIRGYDIVNLYVTGLTVAFGAVVGACLRNDVGLVAWHYNIADNTYYPQRIINAAYKCPYCGHAFGIGNVCQWCGGR